ncbi:putative 4-hydroxyphenylpyruvate dioxygenase [Ascoidea rubescens DSM 1968]|uniref:4-hydroxyphenylpyruvate dioxygenase n=1 Tax=Ascoidea rubescens DSM 1968 TaxID=1344418 RepID=A0A1D2VFY0_9ASCO|nr:putative 4-hydroxyphenylpyruvate dioxygenase [Ascoidea rubescens DSM 1968]ODV60430.1 putative 4-hydroxyphenylpyruvate dioxygenase [Ascoidea rubescens DSM 1968]
MLISSTGSIKSKAANNWKTKRSADYDLLPVPLIKNSSYVGYHHVTWYVSNAKHWATYFVHILGFNHIAYKGLETGSRNITAHVVSNNQVIFQFISPLRNDNAESKKIWKHILKHGDAVKDVAFKVDNLKELYKVAIGSGAKSLMSPTELQDDSNNDYSILMAQIKVFNGDTTHTLIEFPNIPQTESNNQVFLPGYKNTTNSKRFNFFNSESIQSLPQIHFEKIDHCVQNQGWYEMNKSCQFYAKVFGFHRFWSVDEKDISTEFSSLRSIVMASENEAIKIPINEPAKGKCKSQIEEFLDYYDGPGIQHIALLTNDIISTVKAMKQRGAEFINVPEIYYDFLKERLKDNGPNILESMDEIKKQGILVDFDENGYLLQLFTKPLGDRPTIFLEIIQRNNHNGFGAGNFKALFETIEAEQKLRGNLEKT